jgi:hypothetical protein
MVSLYASILTIANNSDPLAMTTPKGCVIDYKAKLDQHFCLPMVMVICSKGVAWLKF